MPRFPFLDDFILVAILGLLLASSSTEGKAIPFFAGPYVAYTKMFYMGDPQPGIDSSWYLRVTHFSPFKPNERQRLTGNMTLGPDGLSDHMWVTIIADTRSNNQWKENAFVVKYPNKACTNVRNNIPDVIRVLNHGKPCPIRQGTYFYRDEPVSWVFPNVPILPYGEYRFRLSAGVKDHTCGAFVVEAVVIPKVSAD